MRTKNTPVQITVPDYREPLAGKVATAMGYGALVQLRTDGTLGDPPELVAANGGTPAILESEVMTDANWQLYCQKDPQWVNDIRPPVPVNSSCSARFAKLAEFEGAAFFDTLNGSSTAGTALKTLGGKFKAATVGTDRVIGYLRRLMPPYNATSFRWEVEFVD